MKDTQQKVQIVVADPSALGLFGLAMVTLVASSQKLGFTTGLSFVIPWAILLGSVAQMIACVYDFKHNNLFGATVFGAYGLFWTGVAASWLIKMGVFGPALAAAADVKQLGIAFLGYFIFSIFATIAATETTKVLFVTMVFIDVLLGCLALDALGIGGHWAHGMAAWAELVTAILSLYAAGATFLNKFFGKQFLPLGKPLGIFK
ncbi:Succinate-acetate/proton symporter SatP [bioreactor metagenome]|uniref:Succinate-acetate/proton symporter SatP n=1 Tax=bioreactor metagenome TaxID=1076179 RepID=A0A644TM04_9ZZZZ|nr:acetate uptake transporter [Negativicutes bacterium]